MADNLFTGLGGGSGNGEWNADFILTGTDGVTVVHKLGQDGSEVHSGIPALSGIETGLTAHAGGTQAAGLALSTTKPVHNISTVGTAADSVLLPLATGSGALHYVMNSAAANSLQVFGSGTDTINAVATATGVALAAGKSALFVDYAAGLWFMLKSA